MGSPAGFLAHPNPPEPFSLKLPTLLIHDPEPLKAPFLPAERHTGLSLVCTPSSTLRSHDLSISQEGSKHTDISSQSLTNNYSSQVLAHEGPPHRSSCEHTLPPCSWQPRRTVSHSHRPSALPLPPAAAGCLSLPPPLSAELKVHFLLEDSKPGEKWAWKAAWKKGKKRCAAVLHMTRQR